MTQAWDKNGIRLPVTVLSASPCTVTQIKTKTKDGYSAIQLGFSQKNPKNINKSLKGHLKSILKNQTPRYLREVKLFSEPQVKVGDTINISDVLKVGDIINVNGLTKGRGFAGVIKRWGFKGGPRTHGQSDRQRAPGSIGQGTDPGRVHKGKKMPGRYGYTPFTVKNLKIIKIDSKTQKLWIKGPIPGSYNQVIKITKIKEGKFPGLLNNQSDAKSDTQKKSASKIQETTKLKTKENNQS